MLVDSSVWIDFFNARSTPQTDYLVAIRTRRRILSADLVIAEVLQGERNDRTFAVARQVLLALDVVIVGGADIAVQAATNFRTLRSRGITIRKTVDTLIATRCIEDRIPLLFADRDFIPFVEHLGLRSAMDFPFKVQ